MSYTDNRGQKAYEAYSMSKYGCIHTAWIALPDKERAHWRQAARAVLGRD